MLEHAEDSFTALLIVSLFLFLAHPVQWVLAWIDKKEGVTSGISRPLPTRKAKDSKSDVGNPYYSPLFSEPILSVQRTPCGPCPFLFKPVHKALTPIPEDMGNAGILVDTLKIKMSILYLYVHIYIFVASYFGPVLTSWLRVFRWYPNVCCSISAFVTAHNQPTKGT